MQINQKIDVIDKTRIRMEKISMTYAKKNNFKMSHDKS